MWKESQWHQSLLLLHLISQSHQQSIFASAATDPFHLSWSPWFTVQFNIHVNTSNVSDKFKTTEAGTTLHSLVHWHPQLGKLPRVRPLGGEEFNWFTVGWDRKWSFHRREQQLWNGAQTGASQGWKTKGIAQLTATPLPYISQRSNWCQLHSYVKVLIG